MVTVALNPSSLEFPPGDPCCRFPGISTPGDVDSYIGALSGYFHREPYSSWLGFYDEALQGIGVSYYGALSGTALHTDIGSPLATDPTWSRLDRDMTSSLEADGRPLWHELAGYLQPDVVLWSTARRHLDLIEFRGLADWEPLIAFTHKKDGTPRKAPFKAMSRTYKLSGGKRSLFLFAPAQVKPIGALSHPQKRRLGVAIVERYRRGI